MDIRIGNGFDVHPLCTGRKLILGGINIPYPKGLLGHSDADVLIHSIADALLGSLALGDIGKLFPDTNPKYKNINSMEILKTVNQLLQKKEYNIINIDNTIICQKPKLAPYTEYMKKNIANTLKININRISIKATTTENMGFVGREEGICVFSSCIVRRNTKV